jgi:hypothetical protein
MTLDPRDRQLLEDVLDAASELRAELHRLRTGNLVARLSEADREEIAQRVHERIDERLAPHDDPDHDGAPTRRQRGRSRYFRG